MKRYVYLVLIAFMTMFTAVACGSKTESTSEENTPENTPEQVSQTPAERLAAAYDDFAQLYQDKGADASVDELAATMKELLSALEAFIDSNPSRDDLLFILEKAQQMSRIKDRVEAKMDEETKITFKAKVEEAKKQTGCTDEYKATLNSQLTSIANKVLKPEDIEKMGE